MPMRPPRRFETALGHGRIRHGPRRLDNDFQDFPDQPHGRHDAGFAHGHDGLDQPLNLGERLLAERCLQSVRDGHGRAGREYPALFERARRIIRRRGLHADDANLGPHGLGGHGNAAQMSAAADGAQNRVQFRDLLQHFDGGGPLPRHHIEIVVGMNEGRAGPLHDLPRR